VRGIDDDGASGLFAVVSTICRFSRGSIFASSASSAGAVRQPAVDLSLSWWCEEGEQRFGVGSAARQRSGGHQRGERT
jgi:hypothetical protein